MAHYPEKGDDDKKKKTMWRLPTRCRRGFQLRRQRRAKTERLGGKKPRRRTVVAGALVNMFRKMKMKVKYVCMVKKLKECYSKLVKDIAEGGSELDIFHRRLFMETSLAIPIGITFSGNLYSSRFGPNKTFFV